VAEFVTHIVGGTAEIRSVLWGQRSAGNVEETAYRTVKVSVNYLEPFAQPHCEFQMGLQAFAMDLYHCSFQGLERLLC
jgi:hypothetical protein